MKLFAVCCALFVTLFTATGAERDVTVPSSETGEKCPAHSKWWRSRNPQPVMKSEAANPPISEGDPGVRSRIRCHSRQNLKEPPP